MKHPVLRAAFALLALALTPALRAVSGVQLGLTSTSASVNESGGSVTLTVARTGSLTEVVSVDYTTVVGTATAGADYTTTTGTLSWAAEESGSKTIVVPILEDTANDEAETFDVSLSNPLGGATIASESGSASVTIVDNDDAPAIVSATASTPSFGTTFTISAVFTGATSQTETPISYAWTRGGVSIIDGGRYSRSVVSSGNSTTASLIVTDANAQDNGSYVLTINNGLGTAISSSPVSITVTQSATTRDPATTSISSSASPSAFLNLPDGRTLAAIPGSATGASATSVTGDTNLVLIGTDGTVSATSAGKFTGAVRALYRLQDGKILVVGAFTKVANVAGAGRQGIARLNADLSLDTSFVPSPLPSIGAHAVVTDAQGNIFLGGNFTSYGEQTGYNHLVRLYPDGKLDRSFTRSPQNPDVNALLRQTDGKIVVLGALNTGLNGDSLPIRGIYRLNTDGTLDTDFTPPKSTEITTYDTGALDSQGRIILLKSSSTKTIIRLLPTGVVDTAFKFKGIFDDRAKSVVVLPGDKLLVGGVFSKVEVTTGTTKVSTSLSRHLFLNEDGTWGTTPNVGAFNGEVGAISRSSTGRIWFGGVFTTPATRILAVEGEAPTLAFSAQPEGQTGIAGGSVTFSASVTGNNGFTYAWFKDGEALANGVRISGATSSSLSIAGLTAEDAGDYTVVVTSPSASITSNAAPLSIVTAPEITAAPVAATGDLDGSASFSVSARGASPLTYQWFYEGEPIVGATSATYSIASGLGFGQAGRYSVSVTNGFGSVTSDSVILTVQRRPGVISAGVASPSLDGGEVFALLKLADGSMLVGGSFTSITTNGTKYTREKIARFLANGSIDTTFAPTFNNGNVRALAQDASGRIYVGGDFTSVNFGSTRTNRIRVARLTSGLVLDTAFDTSSTGPAGSVYALAPTGTGSVYVGGAFTQIGLVSSGVNRMALLNATGALDTSFTSAATGDVNAIVYSGGSLYVGGLSNTWTTASSARLVKLDATGARDTGFTSPATTTTVKSLLLLSDGSLLVGGSTGTSSPATSYIKRVSVVDGSETSPAYALTGHSDPVEALAQQSDGKILTGSRGVLKRTDLSDVAESGFDVFNSTVRAIAIDGSGRIWVGGAFGKYGDVDQSRLAILTGGDAQAEVGDLTPQTITFPAITGGVYDSAARTRTLAATASSGLSVTYEVVSGPATVDGSTLTITGAGTITVRATQAGDETYSPATVSNTFTIQKATQTITFPRINNQRTTSPAFTLAATASSGLAITYELSGVGATISGDTVTLTGAASGTDGVTITAKQAGDSLYAPALSVSQTFLVEAIPLKDQTINFPQPAARTFGTAPAVVSFNTNATGLTVTLTVVSGPATLGTDGRTLTLTGAGNVVLTATQAGNEAYNPATPVTRTLVVNKAPQSISFTVPANVTLGNTPPVLAATASSGLTVTYSLVGTTNAGTLSDGVLSFTGAGKVVVSAAQAGDDDYLAAPAVVRTITVKTPSLVLNGLAQTYTGTPRIVTATGAPEGYTPVITYKLGSAAATTTPPTAAGTYLVTASLGTATRSGNLVVKKALLTVTPDNITKNVGTFIPKSGSAAAEFFPLTYSGFVNDETEDVLNTAPTGNSSATASSNKGTYPINVNGGVDNNYEFKYNRGTLTLVGLGGNYEALLVSSGEGAGIIGHLSLTMLNNSFGYTGVLNLAGETSPITIRSGAPSLLVNPVAVATPDLENNGLPAASGLWTRAETSTLKELKLSFAISSTGVLTGSLERDGVENYGVMVLGQLLRPDTTPAPQAGAYTLTLTPPQALVEPLTGILPEGAGHATATISKAGLLAFSGKLPDGTTLTGSAKMDVDGNYRVFLRPYGSRAGNYVGGAVVLDSHPDVGTLYRMDGSAWYLNNGTDSFVTVANLEAWQKPTTSPLVTLGQRLRLTGSSSASAAFSIEIASTALSEAQLASIASITSRTLLPDNTILGVLSAQNPAGFTLKLTPATGAFSGSFKLIVPPTTTARTINFTGVLRQVPGSGDSPTLIGAGQFILPTATPTTGSIAFGIPILD